MNEQKYMNRLDKDMIGFMVGLLIGWLVGWLVLCHMKPCR